MGEISGGFLETGLPFRRRWLCRAIWLSSSHNVGFSGEGTMGVYCFDVAASSAEMRSSLAVCCGVLFVLLRYEM